MNKLVVVVSACMLANTSIAYAESACENDPYLSHWTHDNYIHEAYGVTLPTCHKIAAIRARIKLGGDDEYRLRHELMDILTDTSNEWDDVKRRWTHRTDKDDLELQVEYQAWWDLLNERVDERMAGREFATENERLVVWMAIAHSIDNDMPLAPVNVE